LKARRTLGRLVSVDRRAFDDPEVKAARGERAKVARSGDRQRLREFAERRGQALQVARERLLEEIAADQAEADQAVVQLWRRLETLQKDLQEARDVPDGAEVEKKTRACQVQREALYQLLAARVGSLAPGTTPEGKANLYGCTALGGIRQSGRTVSLTYVGFRCPGVGLPAFGEWLARQGGGDIRFGYRADRVSAEEELDED
jgi:hypothetical protein